MKDNPKATRGITDQVVDKVDNIREMGIILCLIDKKHT